MSLATLVRRMSEAGATPEVIALAIEEIEAIQAALEARRSADRDRKRDQRERQKSANVTGLSGNVTGQDLSAENSQISHDVTGHSADKNGKLVLSPLVPPKVSPEPLSNNPPLSPNPPVTEIARARLGYHRLPDGWQPTRPYPEPLKAKLGQWPPGALGDAIADFKRWAANAEDRNGKGRKLDWDKALWNWLGRRHDERHRRTNGVGRHQPDDGLSPTTRAAVAVFGAPSTRQQ